MPDFRWFVGMAARAQLIDFQTFQEIDGSLAKEVKEDQIMMFRNALRDMRQENKSVLSPEESTWVSVAAKVVQAGIATWEEIGFLPKEIELLQQQ